MTDEKFAKWWFCAGGGTMIQPIHVFERIFRGPRPETISDFNILTGLGIEDILDLQGDPWEVLTHAANRRQFFAWDTGKRTIHIAMNGLLPPNEADTRTALWILARVDKKIYVHCRWGKDRTGYLIAAWRMQFCGWTYNAAVAEMRNNGFHAIYFYWLPSLRKYERKT